MGYGEISVDWMRHVSITKHAEETVKDLGSIDGDVQVGKVRPLRLSSDGRCKCESLSHGEVHTRLYLVHIG